MRFVGEKVRIIVDERQGNNTLPSRELCQLSLARSMPRCGPMCLLVGLIPSLTQQVWVFVKFYSSLVV
jgi:hypothetical protein